MANTNASASPVPNISHDDIRAQLHCILASCDFDEPDRVRAFLSFVVEETLAGRADRIKAYVIAVEVFGRGADFDVTNDPVVRIEAARLRRGLERYYLLAGSSASIVIDIPKGGYVPSFRWQSNDLCGPEQPRIPVLQPSADPRPRMITWLRLPWLGAFALALAIGSLVTFLAMADQQMKTTRASPEGPALVVKPFVNLSGKVEAQVFAAGLEEEILSQLTPTKELRIFRSEAVKALASSVSSSDIDRPLGRRYMLEGVIREGDGKLRISSRLVDGETTAIIWSGIYEADLKALSGFDIETTLASKIVASVSLHRPWAKVQ
ncbi:hypothetical protein [Bosea lathyri]|uniref:TolB amino-terminal domain-containing protein n=1 Tax=Bosea lathyri TaxID=1036778 RepID=A0A1H6BKT5_9HYPH|nr:hypothetical protein [Bosea lathyri]SEG61075.1 TolB amino-terminal domain-containing protein [Bosea lathyri]